MDTWASLRKDKTAVGAARCCENGLGDGEYDAMELFENIVSNILDESPEVPDQVEMNPLDQTTAKTTSPKQDIPRLRFILGRGPYGA
ncbi:unnamed protein product [Mesocestoides corti]|uniref:Uncharacterized protein n=1 Tax=Mesocestoides corti TaxID=53468 RepID=A0A0R3U8P5_MESCO|nr:unnamed protein product [Mesocestoides corti]